MHPDASPTSEVQSPKSPVGRRALPAPQHGGAPPAESGPTGDAPPESPRFRRGDPVLTAGQPAVAVGKIDAVLASRSGERLVVERAFQAGRFTPFAAGRVVASEDDPGTGLRWHCVDVRPADLARLPLYRRVLGRLTPDPVHLLPPAPADDGSAQAALQAALSEEPLTAGADLDVRVVHGVAVLDGWLRTVGGKVIAERLARTTPGVWEAKNRLVSDEEVAALARRHALADARLAGAVTRISCDLGHLTVSLAPGAGAQAAPQAAHDLAQLPGCREVAVVTATAEETSARHADTERSQPS